MSNTKVEESCRFFLDAKKEVKQWVLNPAVHDYRTQQVWRPLLDGQRIFDEIAPVTLRIEPAPSRTRCPARAATLEHG